MHEKDYFQDECYILSTNNTYFTHYLNNVHVMYQLYIIIFNSYKYIGSR